MRIILTAFTICCALGAAAIAPATAQSYPTTPVHVVVPWPPGGVEIFGRYLQPGMAKDLGQPLIYDNKPGANGYIGTEFVARAPADGYTILLNVTGSVVVGPLISSDVRFDVERDFAPIAGLAGGGWVLIVRKGLPVNSLSEFIAYVKSNPGKVNYGSPGLGSIPHLVNELFARAIGAQMIHVPYRGFVPVLQAISGGELDSAIMAFAGAKSLLAKGDAKVLAFDGSDLPTGLSDAPDLTKAVPGFETLRTLSGFWAPATTPRPIVDRLNKSIHAAAAVPEVRAKLIETGERLIIGTPEEFGALVAANAADAKKVVGTLRAAGVKFE